MNPPKWSRRDRTMVLITEYAESTDMDELASMFMSANSISLYNPSHYNLYMMQGALFTSDPIHANSIIGEICGDRAYIWELNHDNYLLVNDELVLDIHRYMSNMLSHVREENQTSAHSNCHIHMVSDTNGTIKFYLVCNRPIPPHTEVVYNVFDFVHTCL
jgi:hypothetical protein